MKRKLTKSEYEEGNAIPGQDMEEDEAVVEPEIAVKK